MVKYFLSFLGIFHDVMKLTYLPTLDTLNYQKYMLRDIDSDYILKLQVMQHTFPISTRTVI